MKASETARSAKNTEKGESGVKVEVEEVESSKKGEENEDQKDELLEVKPKRTRIEKVKVFERVPNNMIRNLTNVQLKYNRKV